MAAEPILFVASKEKTKTDPEKLPDAFREIERWASTLTAGGGGGGNLIGETEQTPTNTALGYNALGITTIGHTDTTGFSDLTGVGFGATANGSGATAIGANTTAGTNGTSVGDGAFSNNSGTAVGENASTGANDATAIGAGAFAQGASSVAIGFNSFSPNANACDIGTQVTDVRQLRVTGASPPSTVSTDICIYIFNTASAPTGLAGTGGVLYVQAGALMYKGGSGTVTTIAPA